MTDKQFNNWATFFILVMVVAAVLIVLALVPACENSPKPLTEQEKKEQAEAMDWYWRRMPEGYPKIDLIVYPNRIEVVTNYPPDRRRV